MIYVLLAEGFEEMEAIAPIDLLRRAGCTVETVSVGNELLVVGAHGIGIRADRLIADITTDALEAVVLPGGMPGTLNLEASEAVQSLIGYAHDNGLILGAICAAPSILGHRGFLEGKHAVCYPGFEKDLIGAMVETASVVTDGTVITAKGAGVADQFGLALVAVLVNEKTAESLREGIQCK